MSHNLLCTEKRKHTQRRGKAIHTEGEETLFLEIEKEMREQFTQRRDKVREAQKHMDQQPVGSGL